MATGDLGVEAGLGVDAGLDAVWGATVVVGATSAPVTLADWVGEGPRVAKTEATATVAGMTTAAHAATIAQRTRPRGPRPPPRAPFT